MHLSFLKKKKRNGIVAMTLPNSIPLFTIPKVFFTPLFRQYHCHNCQKFIPSISAMSLPQTIFFSSNFRQWHCHNCQKKIFPIIWFSLRALTLRIPTRAAGIGRRNRGNTIAKNKKFLSPTFYLSLSNFC